LHLFEPNQEAFSLSKEILEPYQRFLTQNETGILGQETRKELLIPEIDAQTSIYASFLTKKIVSSKWADFTTLPAYLWKNNIGQIDVMKVDVEGSEFEIFSSLEPEIFQKIHVLFLEYHLLNEEFERAFPKLVENLQKHFKTVTIIEGKYTKKIGYILCY
jgi:FkbM family methyltransferase